MKRKKDILLVIETSRAFGRGLLQGISHHVLEHDEWIVQIESQDLLESTPSWLKQWKGDGIIARTASMSVANVLRKFDKPMVELLGNGTRIRPEVHNDESRVASLTVEHFAQSGFTHFGFFSIGNSWWTELRQRYFIKEVDRLKGNKHIFPLAGEGPREFYPSWMPKYEAVIQRWLHRLPKPIGIWATSDTLAIRLLETCRRNRIAVPEEVAILGTTNDVLLCNILSPALSSIDLNAFRIGYAAAERLAIKLRGKTPEQTPILIEPRGVVARQSTNMIAISDEIVTKAIRFIRDNATLNISIDSIARKIDISRSTLQRRFRRLTGRTLEKEILKMKMERAKRLLTETNFNLTDVAEKSGFGSMDYFVQVFRRENGITPHRYRKAQQLPPEAMIAHCPLD